jgi:hypothetical protein
MQHTELRGLLSRLIEVRKVVRATCTENRPRGRDRLERFRAIAL